MRASLWNPRCSSGWGIKSFQGRCSQSSLHLWKFPPTSNTITLRTNPPAHNPLGNKAYAHSRVSFYLCFICFGISYEPWGHVNQDGELIWPYGDIVSAMLFLPFYLFLMNPYTFFLIPSFLLRIRCTHSVLACASLPQQASLPAAPPFSCFPAPLFIPSHQTLSKLISKSWEHLIVLINPMPGEIWFCAREDSQLLCIDSLFWIMPAFPI